jgi:diguanylate cyclase (GGDEF)-like protein
MHEKYIGPLPLADYTNIADRFPLPLNSPITEELARESYGRRMAQLALQAAVRKLDQLIIDTTSGLLCKDEGRDQARRRIASFQDGSRPADKHKSAVLFSFDAEKFKSINETLGHQEGDRRLGLIGNYLKNKTRTDNGDIVWRNGGDEFNWLVIFDARSQTAAQVITGIENRLMAQDDDRHPDMPCLRWNHAIYQPGDTLEDLLSRSDSKGDSKPRVRSQSQSPMEYSQALGMALSY